MSFPLNSLLKLNFFQFDFLTLRFDLENISPGVFSKKSTILTSCTIQLFFHNSNYCSVFGSSNIGLGCQKGRTHCIWCHYNNSRHVIQTLCRLLLECKSLSFIWWWYFQKYLSIYQPVLVGFDYYHSPIIAYQNMQFASRSLPQVFLSTHSFI